MDVALFVFLTIVLLIPSSIWFMVTWEYIEILVLKTTAGKDAAKVQPQPGFPKFIKNIVTHLQPETNTHQPPDGKHKRKKGALRIVLGWILIIPLTIGGAFLLISLSNNYFISLIPEHILNLENENRRDAIDQLSGLGHNAVEPLITTYHDTENEYLKSGIVEALRQIRDKEALEPLIAVLNDEDPTIRAAAVEALGWIVDERAVEPLIAVLNDEDPTVRAGATWALGIIEDERAVEPLIAILNDEAQTVRVGAAQALVKIGDERAVKPLMAALKRRDLAVIAEASALFIKRGKAGDEPILIEALNAYGTKETANNYLNCGNNELENAAREWAKLNGYEIIKSNLRDGVYWGSE
jgi:hypothetical protein